MHPSALPRDAGAPDVSGRASVPRGARPLTRQERDMLAVEEHGGDRKAELIEQLFPGLSMVRYWQLLNALIDRPEAAAHAPEVVRQLREVRARRPQRRVPAVGVRRT